MAKSYEREPRSNNGTAELLPSSIPGQIVVEIPGFKNQDSIASGIKNGRIGSIIKRLHDEEKHVIATKRPGKMVLYVASSLGLMGAIAGGVYLRARKKRG